MQQAQPIVIVDRNGTEHEFPAGFDPKKAAEIVRKQLDAGRAPETPISAQPPQHPMGRFGNALVDAAVGFGKGVAERAVDLGSAVHKIPGVSGAVDALYGQEGLSERAFPAAREAMQPTNAAQRAGQFVERAAEFAIPAGRVASMTRGASLPARAAAQGATSAAVSAAQGGDTRDVLTAGTVGAVSPALGDVASAVGQRAFQALPEKLYAQVFRYANDDLRKAYQALAKGKPPSPTLSREMLERGVMGSSDEMAVYSLQKLDALESALQTAAARKVLVLPKKSEYIAQLDDLATRFKDGFLGEKGAEARALRDALAKMPGPSARATDMLKVKRFLDGMRTSSSFRLDPTLTPKQEELKIAADLIRSTLHKQADLSKLISDERVFIEAVDAIVTDAVRRGNRSVFGIVDAALSSAGMKGVMASGVVRGAQMPKAITGAAQMLYQGGQAAPSGAAISRTGAAAVNAGGGR